MPIPIRTSLVALALLSAAACTDPPARGATQASSASAASSTTGSGGSRGAAPDAGSDQEAGAPEGLRALFIGNSYTYVNDLPGHVNEMAATARLPPTIDVASVTAGGATFADQWNGAEAQPAIAKGDDTHVVLQAQSVEPVFAPEGFHQYGSLLANAATAAGAKPVLYETWARKAGDPVYIEAWSGGSPDAMQDGLSAAYEKLANDTGASVAPVGEAWRIAWTQHPEIELYQPDGSHPTPSGTYLAACVFYIVLTGHSLAAASAPPPDVSPADASTLREIATEVTSAK